MVKNKPFTRTEMKILIYNKMKNKHLSYDQAKKELADEVASCIANNEKMRKEEKERKKSEKNDAKKFKEDFEKLTNGNKKSS